MPTVTITTELTKDALAALRDQIDVLIAGVTFSGPAEPRSFNVDGIAAELKGRLSPAIRRLVETLAKEFDGKTFTWEDVAKAMQANAPSVKSWHRSLSKPLNRLAAANPSAPALLSSRWDGFRNNYEISSDWAETIRRTW